MSGPFYRRVLEFVFDAGFNSLPSSSSSSKGVCRDESAGGVAGVDLLRVNHVGDYGTQFGMLIALLKQQQQPEQLVKGAVERDLRGALCDREGNTGGGTGGGVEYSVSDLQVLYKQAKLRFDQDEAFRQVCCPSPVPPRT